MHFNIEDRTILLVRHGSHAYGLSTPTSDEDFKGVCIKPKECYLGFTRSFDQHEHMGSKNDGIDSVIYSIDKFAKLAADCNPNIIEVLHVDDSDVVKIDAFGEALRAMRGDFLSKKAKFTFSGYAHAQLKRIKTHKGWLDDPPEAPPTRAQFGLSDEIRANKAELGALQSLLSDEDVDLSLLEAYVSNETFLQRLVTALKYVFGRRTRPEDVITLFTRERAYQSAKTKWDQYQNWVETRNPARAELEAKYGYDTKHGMHLIRLMMMATKILRDHVVQVKWAGAEQEYLMGVRKGMLAYDPLIEEAERLEKLCDELYKTSTLRKEPDRAKVDDTIVSLTSQYLSLHG